MRLIRFTIIISFIFLTASVFAADLDNVLANLQSYSANFKETVLGEKKHVISESFGTMALVRPGHFRWDTTKPTAQKIIADGHRLYIYDIDLAQVTIKKLDVAHLGDSPALLLAAHQNLNEKYHIQNCTTTSGKCFELTPKSTQSDFKHIVIFTDVDNVIDAMRLVDSLGQETNIQFSHIKMNPTLSATLFQFKPPKNVDVIQDNARA